MTTGIEIYKSTTNVRSMLVFRKRERSQCR